MSATIGWRDVPPIVWITAVMLDRKLPVLARLVALYLCLHINDEDHLAAGIMKTWPSQKKIFEDLGVSRRGVQLALEQLLKRGWLHLLYSGKGKDYSNHYELRFREGAIIAPVASAKDTTLAQKASAKTDITQAYTVSDKQRVGAPLRPPVGGTEAPRPVVQRVVRGVAPAVNPRSTKAADIEALVFSDKSLSDRVDACANECFRAKKFNAVYDAITKLVGDERGFLLTTLLLSAYTLDQAETHAREAEREIKRKGNKSAAQNYLLAQICTPIYNEGAKTAQDFVKALKTHLRITMTPDD